MSYREELKKIVETSQTYEELGITPEDLNVCPGEILIGIPIESIEKFLEALMNDTLKSNPIPLLPVVDRTKIDVDAYLEFAAKADIYVCPVFVDASLEVFATGDTETILSVLSITPYYSVRALALFDSLLLGATYNTKEAYTLGVTDKFYSDEILLWLLYTIGIAEPLDTMSGAEIIAKILSKLCDTKIGFLSYGKSVAKGKQLVHTLVFKLSQEVYDSF